MRSLGLVALLLLATGAQAEVVDVAATGFLVKDVAVVGAPPDRVYAALTGHVAEWWDSAHTVSGDARNLSLDAKPGGCFCETLPGGGGVRHMTVVFVEPGRTLRLVGALGPLQAAGLSGSMTWGLQAAGDSTRVDLAYSVGGYFHGDFATLAPLVDTVLNGQLQRLKQYAQRVSPTR
jgi:hypothetical protein